MKNSFSIKEIVRHFKEDKNKLEWIVFFAGLVILITVIAYLGVQWARHKKEEVLLSVTWQKDPAPGSPHRYLITLSNTGSKTVKNVQVQAGCWRQQQQEKVSILFDMSPRRSSSEAWIQFSPAIVACDSIEVYLSGYQ